MSFTEVHISGKTNGQTHFHIPLGGGEDVHLFARAAAPKGGEDSQGICNSSIATQGLLLAGYTEGPA